MAEDVVVETTEDRSMARRAVLKAGIAGGVAVTAWSIPHVIGVGVVPAYASHCTQSFELKSDKVNANCGGCNSPLQAYIQYGNAGQQNTFGVAGSFNGTAVSADVTFTDKCSGAAKPVGVTITSGNFPGYTCFPSKVIIFQASGGGTPIGQEPAIQVDGSYVFPKLLQSTYNSSGNCNIFFNLVVKCCN